MAVVQENLPPEVLSIPSGFINVGYKWQANVASLPRFWSSAKSSGKESPATELSRTELRFASEKSPPVPNVIEYLVARMVCHRRIHPKV
jgi:hypothetical protein